MDRSFKTGDIVVGNVAWLGKQITGTIQQIDNECKEAPYLVNGWWCDKVEHIQKQEFKTGDVVEVQIEESCWKPAIFVGYATGGSFTYIARLDGIITMFLNCRKPKPNLQPGQPILVWDYVKDYRCIESFKAFDCDRRVVDSDGCIWKHYELLEHYDYTEGGKY